MLRDLPERTSDYLGSQHNYDEMTGEDLSENDPRHSRGKLRLIAFGTQLNTSECVADSTHQVVYYRAIRVGSSGRTQPYAEHLRRRHWRYLEPHCTILDQPLSFRRTSRMLYNHDMTQKNMVLLEDD